MQPSNVQETGAAATASSRPVPASAPGSAIPPGRGAGEFSAGRFLATAVGATFLLFGVAIPLTGILEWGHPSHVVFGLVQAFAYSACYGGLLAAIVHG